MVSLLGIVILVWGRGGVCFITGYLDPLGQFESDGAPSPQIRSELRVVLEVDERVRSGAQHCLLRC